MHALVIFVLLLLFPFVNNFVVLSIIIKFLTNLLLITDLYVCISGFYT